MGWHHDLESWGSAKYCSSLYRNHLQYDSDSEQTIGPCLLQWHRCNMGENVIMSTKLLCLMCHLSRFFLLHCVCWSPLPHQILSCPRHCSLRRLPCYSPHSCRPGAYIDLSIMSPSSSLTIESGLRFCCSITRDNVVRKSMKNWQFRFLLNCSNTWASVVKKSDCHCNHNPQ